MFPKTFNISHTFRFMKILTQNTYLQGRCILELRISFRYFGGGEDSA